MKVDKLTGMDCYLVDMPFHMAFFGISRAETILDPMIILPGILAGIPLVVL